MVLDAEITRAELSAFNDVLHWSENGSIAINTYGQLTILSPKYVKSNVKYANQLFNILKIELDELPKNSLSNSDLVDEVGTTLFSGTDVTITKLKWSPLTSNLDSYLGILTNRQSVLILKNGKVLHDLTTADSFDSQSALDEHLAHSIGWLKTEEGDLQFITGLASGHVKSYTITNDEIAHEETVAVSESKIVDVKGFNDLLVIVSSSNEIYTLRSGKLARLKEADRFGVYDIYVHSGSLFYTTYNKLTKLTIASKNNKTIKTGLLSTTTIVPSGSHLLLVSDTKTTKVDNSLNIISDDTLEPILRKRLNKWNSDFDDFHTKNYILKIFGVDLNFNGSVLAVLFEIQNRQGFRYKIASENTFKIVFIPLNNTFKNQGSAFAVYQGFKLTGDLPTVMTQSDGIVDFSLSFEEFLKVVVLKHPVIIKAQTENLVSGNQDDVIRKKFAELVIEYVETNKVDISDVIDEAVFGNLLIVAGKPPNKSSNDITFFTGNFEQTFNFSQSSDIDTVQAKSGHIWPRCALSFLPILSPFVKIDPVTERRIIDIERDSNEYGPFTQALLSLNEISLYSGSQYIKR